jgi:hypothetical protein
VVPTLLSRIQLARKALEVAHCVNYSVVKNERAMLDLMRQIVRLSSGESYVYLI